MKLDKEDHRAILLGMIDAASIPGRFAEDIAALKAAVRAAEIEAPAHEADNVSRLKPADAAA